MCAGSTLDLAFVLAVQLGVDGVFSDFVEGVVFYLRFSRQNADFPKRQVLPLLLELRP